jgi:uncharacterized phage infection (PIP) family protein YhgE
MVLLKNLFKNRLFIIGLLVPFLFQIVYFCIAIPAVKNADKHVDNLNIAIINEDQNLGRQIVAQLSTVLPFNLSYPADLASALDTMDSGETNMVLYISPDFSASAQQGTAAVAYYINQSAPAMTKQLMEKTALAVNQTLNENIFLIQKGLILQKTLSGLSQSGLPEPVLSQLSANLSAVFDSLKYDVVTGDIQKVNDSQGFAQTVMPFFIFLTYFVGSIIMSVLHNLSYRSLRTPISRSRLLLTQFGVNLVVSILLPCVVIGLLQAFGIPLSLGSGTAWLLLSTAFLVLLYLVQMFGNWLGIMGIGMAALVLFPMQLMSSGLMYSREILPAAYSVIGDCLPVSYFGDGMLKMFYGGNSISGDITVLLIMLAVFLAVSALSVLKKSAKHATAT